MPSAIEEVLNDLGWSDGFRIPIANAENKQLEEEIERKTRLRAKLKTQLETTQERVQEICKHASDIRQEQKQNERLLAAHSTQYETENNMYKLAQFEESKLTQSTKQNEIKMRDLTDRVNILQQNVNKLTKKLEASKNNILQHQDRLLSWEEKLNKKEEKNMIIEQFMKSDEKTFKKIEYERQTLSEKAEVYRQAMITAVGDVNELEMTLDKTARLYKQAVKDRRELMDQWSLSVRVLTQRDKSIHHALQDITSLREIAKERMEVHQEAERFFDILLQNNRELEENIKDLDKEMFYYREEHRKLTNMNDTYSVELHVQEKLLQDLAGRIQNLRSNIKRKRNDVDNKRTKLQNCKQTIADLKVTLKNIEGQKMNVEQRTRQLQDILEKEEKHKASITKEIKRQQSLILNAQARLNELEGECALLINRQEGETKHWDTLLSEQSKEEKILKERKDRVYHTDVELQKCEMRLQHLLGEERDKTELEFKQKRLLQLQKTFKEKSETVKTLNNQLSQVDNEIRKVSNLISANTEELQRLKDKQQELMVLIEGGEKQLKVIQSSYEERKVDQNILELRLKEASKIILKVDDKLYDLEKYALQMEAAMQERRSEIKAQKESLNLQKRVLLAECQDIRNMIAERKIRIEQLQTRYNIHVAALGTNEDGTPLTTTYLMIQSAQERYLLQERGDKLDRAIRKSEMEIRSMENTLRLVNACNDKYKSSLSIVDDHSPEKIEQRQLDEELFNALEQLRQKRKEFERFKDDCKRMEENCEQLEKDIESIREEKENKQQTVSSLEQQINEQREKIIRADKNLRTVLKDVQNKCICRSDETILLQEKDIVVREIQEQNTLALQRITEFTIRHVEAETYVKKLLDKRNISLPSVYYLNQPATPLSTSRCSSSISKSSSRLSNVARQPSRESALSGSSIINFEADFSGSDSMRTPKTSMSSFEKRTSKRK